MRKMIGTAAVLATMSVTLVGCGPFGYDCTKGSEPRVITPLYTPEPSPLPAPIPRPSYVPAQGCVKV